MRVVAVLLCVVLATASATNIFLALEEMIEQREQSLAELAAKLPPADFSSSHVNVFTTASELETAMKGKKCVIVFFNANCGHCKTFAPQYKEAAERCSKDGPKDVVFYAMDAEKHPNIPAGFKFQYYPSIFYVDASGTKVAYTDSRDAYTLHNFVKNAGAAAPSLLEGGTQNSGVQFYQSLMKDYVHPTDCARTQQEESHPSLIDTMQEIGENTVMLDAEAYDGDVAAQMARERAFMEASLAVNAKTEAKTEAKAEAKAEAKTEAKAEAKAEAKTEAKAKAKTEAKAEAKTEAKADTETEAEAEAETESETEADHEVDAESEAEAEHEAEQGLESAMEADIGAHMDQEMEHETEAEEED